MLMSNIIFCILVIVIFYAIIFGCVWIRLKLHKKHDWSSYPFQTEKDVKLNRVRQRCKVCGACRYVVAVKRGNDDK